MITIVNETTEVRVPTWVKDLRSFRRWADTDDFPQTGRICFFQGGVWGDMSKEQVFSHTLVKTEYSYVLTGLTKQGIAGLYLGDGLLVNNLLADFSAKPDGTLISVEALRTQEVRLVEGAERGFVEVEGTPDMVLEVLSDSSEYKDTVLLRDAYWKAGIREGWLVDARGESLVFDILKYTSRGYVAVRKQDGWVKSGVFGKSFRLTRRTNALGHPEFTLAVR